MQNAFGLFRWAACCVTYGAVLIGASQATAKAAATHFAAAPADAAYRIEQRARQVAQERHLSYLWCVPYAREVSRIELHGDAFLWWAESEGRYARGWRPELGSLLAFRSIPRMPLGHLAVVVKIISSREILVSQANWVPDTVTRNVPVIDVSPDNDWTEVRQSVGGGRFGMVYPTYGFIYGQPPARTIVADRGGGSEVAEAPPASHIRLTAPHRNLQ